MNSDALVTPKANITETEKSFEIKLGVPGLDRADFTVEVNNNVLFVSATKNDEKTEDITKYLRKEFSYNSFYRSFTIPKNSQPDKIDASYQNSILLISLPKKRIVKTPNYRNHEMCLYI